MSSRDSKTPPPAAERRLEEQLSYGEERRETTCRQGGRGTDHGHGKEFSEVK